MTTLAEWNAHPNMIAAADTGLLDAAAEAIEMIGEDEMEVYDSAIDDVKTVLMQIYAPNKAQAHAERIIARHHEAGEHMTVARNTVADVQAFAKLGRWNPYTSID